MSDKHDPNITYHISAVDDATHEIVYEMTTNSRGEFLKAVFESNQYVVKYKQRLEKEEHDRMVKITQESIVNLEDKKAEVKQEDKPLPPPVEYGNDGQPVPPQSPPSEPPMTLEDRVQAKRKELNQGEPRELPVPADVPPVMEGEEPVKDLSDDIPF